MTEITSAARTPESWPPPDPAERFSAPSRWRRDALARLLTVAAFGVAWFAAGIVGVGIIAGLAYVLGAAR